MGRIIAIIIAITTANANANAQPPMGPIAPIVEKVGPTKAAFEKATWEKNMPKYRDFGPYGINTKEARPLWAGLLSDRKGTVSWCPSPKSNTGFVRCKESKETLNQRIARRKKAMKMATPSVTWAVKEAGLAYGKTFRETGRSLYKNLKGE